MAGSVMALMTVTGANGPPSLEAAAAELGVTVDDIDQSFGIVAVDPQRGLYCVQVPADRVPTDTGSGETGSGETYRGPFSNPKIAPFGPVVGKKRA
jgi:hypothetical protein